MRRRTNKSAKVPNVKLRPAPAGALSRTSSDRFLVPNTQLDSDDTAYADSCPKPLEHLIICATGIKDKPTVFKKAAELGANYVNAFTDKVTHLIADTHGGAKYMCALERKIPIMKSSWVEESFDIWLKGDDVDLDESLIVHRLPIFSGVVLCLSGITDLERRLQVNKLVTQNGGTYVKNLERPVRVTHLLCSGDEETDKMRYAAKFNKRKEANIHLVWEEWFWDSLEFGGRFDEATYQMSRPRPERKAQPDIASSPPPSEFISEMDDTLEKRPKPQLQSSSSNQDGEDEVANVKILPAVTLQIWGSLLNRRGYEVSGTELVRTTSAPAALFGGACATDGGDNDDFRTPDIQQPGKSVISAFRRATSFAPVKSLESEGGGGTSSVTSRQQPFRRTTTTSTNTNMLVKSVLAVETNGESSTSSEAAAIHEPVAGPSNFPANAMFAGYKFRALGEAKTQAVKNAVESYGGRMVNEWDEEVDFIIVRLVSGSKLYREEMDPILRSKYRTECWLERCIFEDKVCPPDADISFTPLAIETPIPGAENIVLSISGLDQSESCALRRLLRALGITLAPTFSRRTTHLLCPSGIGQKFEKACEWGKPVVGMTWLAVMASTGCIPPVEEHLVSRSTTPAAAAGSSKFDFGLPAEIDVKGKGKGKAVPQDLAPIDVGAKMNDITNTDNSESPAELPHHHSPNFPPRKHQSKPNLQTSWSSSSSTSSSLSFGQPRHGLGEPAAQGVSPASLPPRSGSPSSSSPASAIPLRFQQSMSSESFTQSFNNNSPNTNSSNEAPKPTWQQLEQERLTANIPSSRTPSPLKLVGVAAKQGSGNRASVSPVKIDHEVTTALQESITRALKRHTSEEDDVLNTGRSSKRQRPQRRKAPTRQASERDITDISSVDLNPIPLMPFVGSTISPFESFEITESDMLPVVELTTAIVGGTKKLGKLTSRRGRNAAGVRESVIPEELEEEEDSVRVVYEDPGLADERKKLMKLLKGQSRESPSRVAGTASSSVRRGTRTRKSTK